MKFYDQLQLSAADSKKLIKSAEIKKQKRKYILNFIFKDLITIIFCVLFVLLFTKIFGSENSIVGVSVLLFLLTFRQIHLGYKLRDSVISMMLIFIILAVSPYLASNSSAFMSLCINIISIFIIVFLSTYRVEFYNHAIIVLSYLLIYGNSNNIDYKNRFIAIICGGILISLCLFRNHRKIEFDKNYKDLFIEFSKIDSKSLWKIKLSLGVSGAVFLGELLGLEKSMWIGIATMSVLTPFPHMRKEKLINRVLGTILGSILFMILIYIFPESIYSYMGLIGGMIVGFCATYKYQTMFNALGALSMAMLIYGSNSAAIIRVVDNLFAVVFVIIFSFLFDKIFLRECEFNRC